MSEAQPKPVEGSKAAAASAGETLIDVSQLRPGVHVRLPLGWTEHPFLFNSFVITDAAQIRQIAALKLPQLFSDPSR